MMTHTEMIQSDNSSAEKKNIDSFLFSSISLFKFYLYNEKELHLYFYF